MIVYFDQLCCVLKTENILLAYTPRVVAGNTDRHYLTARIKMHYICKKITFVQNCTLKPRGKFLWFPLTLPILWNLHLLPTFRRLRGRCCSAIVAS